MSKIIQNPKKARFVNGTCTEIENLGYFDTSYGTVRRVKYTFKTDELDQQGDPLIVNRVFNDDMCRTASQRKAIHRWLDKAIPNDQVGYFDRATLLNTTCRLKITPTPKCPWPHEVEIYGPPAKGRNEAKQRTQCETNN
jgi:hypothetical protein